MGICTSHLRKQIEPPVLWHPALVGRSLVVAEGGVGVYFGGGMGWDQAGDEGYADQ
jgi:hypothetical protein